MIAASWWHEFFHAPADLSSLALFRILVGVLIVANAVSYSRIAGAVLHPDGLLPFEIWKSGPERRYFSILRWLPRSPRSVNAVLLVHGLAGACLATGWGTSWAAAAAFLTGVSLNYRNRWVLHSGDALLRMLTFLLIFSEAGSLWSIDAARAAPAEDPGSPWALRLMQLQVSVLYLFSVWHKLQGRTWRRGTASHYATSFLAHRRRRLPEWLDRAVTHRVATYATLTVELAGGLLIWFQPTRYFAIGGLVALHLSLQFLMRMHLFQLLMLAFLILFVPGETTARLVALVWPSG